MAMNPIIKFTTLFGLLAVELAVGIDRTTSLRPRRRSSSRISMVFVWRSFYGMRIKTTETKSQRAGRVGRRRRRSSRADRADRRINGPDLASSAAIGG